MIAWTKDGSNNLSLVLNQRQYYVNATDEVHGKVLEALRNGADEDELVNLIDKAKRVQEYLELQDDNLRIDGGAVIYTDECGHDEILHGTVVDRLLSFIAEGLPIKGLVNFIKKVMQNVSYQAGMELYDFLEHRSLPICEDGDFLAYKAISGDYKDKWTNSLDYSIGSRVRESRRLVDDDRTNACSKGLHAGTLAYCQSYGCFTKLEDGTIAPSSDIGVIVKINPAHVVSVPTCSSYQKLRCEEFLILKKYEGELEYHLATNEGNEYEDEDEWDNEEDDLWDDDDDDDDDDDFGNGL